MGSEENQSPGVNLFPTGFSNPTRAQAEANPQSARVLDHREAVLEEAGYAVDRENGLVGIEDESA